MSSAAEAEVAGLFINAKEGEILRTTLQQMGFTQEATPIQTGNSTASGIANDTINQQRSWSIDMLFYWVRDRVKQGHFKVFWPPGKTNLIHPDIIRESDQPTSIKASPRPHFQI
jgi:hypothetical protein